MFSRYRQHKSFLLSTLSISVRLGSIFVTTQFIQKNRPSTILHLAEVVDGTTKLGKGPAQNKLWKGHEHPSSKIEVLRYHPSFLAGKSCPSLKKICGEPIGGKKVNQPFFS